MLSGHNTNVTLGAATFHVQTEDRGVSTALLETTVFCAGRVVHRRTAAYSDLLPLNAAREAILRSRLDEQHRTVLEELRAGSLNLPAAPA